MSELNNYFQKSTVTREFLAKAIKREVAININKASIIVDQVIGMLIKGICQNKEIKIRLFGTFTTRSKKARVGRNPKTMIQAEIPARKTIKLKVAPKLKKRINDNIHLIG